MDDHMETAFLAGGCTWIMQPLLSHPAGVLSTRTGFMGGEKPNPNDEDCGSHAEVTEVVFDPARLSFRGLLEVFFQVHRPDLDASTVGSQYRSEIFLHQFGAAHGGVGDDPRRRRIRPLAG